MVNSREGESFFRVKNTTPVVRKEGERPHCCEGLATVVEDTLIKSVSIGELAKGLLALSREDVIKMK